MKLLPTVILLVAENENMKHEQQNLKTNRLKKKKKKSGTGLICVQQD
jgi:hypothetical protein